MKINVNKNFVMSKNEYIKQYGRKSNKCQKCGKQYKMPESIFEPRMKYCSTCETLMGVCKNSGVSFTFKGVTYE